jgi:hypothetical protein
VSFKYLLVQISSKQKSKNTQIMHQNIRRINYTKWKNKWAGHVVRMWELRNTYNILFGKHEGMRLLGRPRRAVDWKENIKTDLKEMQFGGVDWIHLAQDRDGRGGGGGSCEYGNERAGSITCREFIDKLRDFYHLKKDSDPWSYLGQLYGRINNNAGNQKWWLICKCAIRPICSWNNSGHHKN